MAGHDRDLTANPPWLARVDHPDGWVLGAGFLVDERTVLTCGHTVPAPEAGGAMPVEVRFVHSSSAAPVRGQVAAADHHLDPDGATDLAVIRLDGPVPLGALAAPLVGARQLAGHAVVLTGFPEVPGDWGDQGEWGSRAEAVVSTQGGPRLGWWELLDRSSGPPVPWVAEGFSGGPVWSTTANGVVAMTVAGSEDRRQAYAIPLDALVEVEPSLRLRVQPPPDDTEVEAELRAELDALEARLPPSDPRITGARYGLAVTLLAAQGDPAEAERLLAECIDDVDVYGHPPARAYGMWLAIAEVRLGERRDDEALDAIARARAVAEAAFGADDPRLAGALAREALARLQRGDVAAADAAARRGQTLAGTGPAVTMFDVLYVRAQVAAMRDPAEAERLTKRLHELGRRTVPPGHPGLVRPILLRGHSLAALGERAEARELFDEALALARDRYPRTHGEVADCHLALAQLTLTESPGTSLDTCLRALDAGEAAFTDRPARLVPYLLLAGSARQASGDPVEAFALADRAVEVATRNLAPDHAGLVEVHAARAQVTDPAAHLAELVADADRAHALAGLRAPDVVPMMVPALTTLSAARLLAQRPGDAADLAREALGLVEHTPFARLPVAGAAHRALGMAEYHLERFDDAATHLTTALRTNESFFGTAHPVVGFGYLELSECQRRRNDAQAAVAARDKGLAVLDRALPSDHPGRRQLDQLARAAAGGPVAQAAGRVARWLSRPVGRS
jgi:tetratricopeptide (TPR) repeat protein